MLATELFAISQGTKCEGNELCHWCGAACKRFWMHDNPPPIPFTKQQRYCKFPNSHWICAGCWMFRRKSVTMPFMIGGFKDRQCASDHSLFITEKGCWSLLECSAEKIYTRLLTPCSRFVLSLKDGNEPNRIQYAIANDLTDIQENTPIQFTFNSRPFHYTIYELEQALRNEEAAIDPGSQLLVKTFGPFELPPLPEKPKPSGAGRPPAKEDGRITKRTVMKDRVLCSGKVAI